MTSAENTIIVELFGEGKSDIDETTTVAELPTNGTIPILVYKKCGSPSSMRVKRKALLFLQGKGLWQKVKFAKRQASLNSGTKGAVFVLDSEGSQLEVLSELTKGRDDCCPNFPMAIGVAHPCIESWLLADASAIRRGLNLQQRPTTPESPEALPAPRLNRTDNPKTRLGACVSPPRSITAAEKAAIARFADPALIESRCPSFKAFSVEIEASISKLFTTGATGDESVNLKNTDEE